jgi:hypothetical protein
MKVPWSTCAFCIFKFFGLLNLEIFGKKWIFLVFLVPNFFQIIFFPKPFFWVIRCFWVLYEYHILILFGIWFGRIWVKKKKDFCFFGFFGIFLKNFANLIPDSNYSIKILNKKNLNDSHHILINELIDRSTGWILNFTLF